MKMKDILVIAVGAAIGFFTIELLKQYLHWGTTPPAFTQGSGNPVMM